MTNLQRVLGSVKKATASWDAVFLRNLEIDATNEVKRKPYSKSSIVFTCISTTSRTIAQVPMVVMQKVKTRNGNRKTNSFIGIKAGNRLYRRLGNGYGNLIVAEKNLIHKGEYWEQVYENDPWQKLITNPNSLMSSQRLIEELVSHLYLAGNIWILGFPYDPRIKVPVELWPVKRENIDPVKTKETGQLEGWKYKPDMNSQGFPIHVDDLIAHIRFFNPDDFIMGLPPLEAGKTPLSGAYKGEIYNEKFFDHSAVPLGVLKTEKHMTPPQRAQLREEWMQRHGGHKKGHEIAILHNKLEYQQIGLTQADMQMFEYLKWSRDQIIQILGMKKAIISITEDLPNAIMTGQRKEWWTSTLIPVVRMIENSINFGLLKGDPNLKVMFDLSMVKALQEDLKEKAEISQTFFNMGVPFNQINERLELGFDPLSNGDIGYLPFSLAPVDALRQIEEPKPIDDENENDNDDSKVIAISPKLITQTKTAWEEKAEKLWKGITRKTDKIEAQFEKKTKRVFFEYRKNILSLLYNGATGKTKMFIIKAPVGKELADNIALINEYNHKLEDELLRKYTEIYYEQAVEVGKESIEDETGEDIPFEMDDPVVVDYLKKKLNKIVDVNKTILGQIRDVIALGVDEGDDVEGIAARIKTQFDFAKSKSKTIARTEVFGANNFSRNLGVKRSGFKWKQWFTAADDRVRDEHKANELHGRIIRTNEKWIVAGEELKYPGDPSGSAWNVINCRCIELVSQEGP